MAIDGTGAPQHRTKIVCVHSFGFRLNAQPYRDLTEFNMAMLRSALKQNTGNSFSHRVNEYTYLVHHPFGGV